MSTQTKLTSFTVVCLLLVIGGKKMKPVEGDEYKTECLRRITSGQLSQCINYLVYGHQGPPEVFRVGHNSEILDHCCKQLGEVEQECRCHAIDQMLLEEEKHIESQKLKGVVRRARNLPAMCGMEPHRCDFQLYI